MNTQIIIISDPMENTAFQSWNEARDAYEFDDGLTLDEILNTEYSDYRSREIDLENISADDLSTLELDYLNYPHINGLTEDQSEYVQRTMNLLDEYREIYGLSQHEVVAPDNDGFLIYRAFRRSMENGNTRIRTGRSERNYGKLLVSQQSESSHRAQIDAFLEQHPGALNENQIAGSINGSFELVVLVNGLKHLRQCKMAGISSPFNKTELRFVLKNEATRIARFDWYKLQRDENKRAIRNQEYKIRDMEYEISMLQQKIKTARVELENMCHADDKIVTQLNESEQMMQNEFDRLKTEWLQ